VTSQRRRVVVSGMGALCPLGQSWKQVRDRLVGLESGVTRIDEWDEVERLGAHIAGRIPDFVKPDHYPRKKTRSMGRVALLATRASELALEDAKLLDSELLGSGRFGIAYGSGAGSKRAIVAYCSSLHGRKSMRAIATSDFAQAMSHTTSANLAQFYGVRGRQIPTAAACVSSSLAIGFGYETIHFGVQDAMLVGGAEELDVMDVAVFDVMHATSTRNDDPARASRPFDNQRDGIVVAEGAGSLILEDLDHARARQAPIYAEIVGFGTNSDGAHITDPDSEGMQRAMELALEDAGLASGDIGYLNAHATATEKGDIAESHAIERVFDTNIPVSSSKSYMGHALGACGVLEAWMTIEMMREGWFAPTLNLDEIDARCGRLDYIRGAIRELQVEYAMSNNFAFGGLNTSLIFRRWRDQA
jgi:3-oxoacyl-[acyl-carrier-protein] synthase II